MYAETYTIEARQRIDQDNSLIVNGSTVSKRITSLTSADTLVVTHENAQIWLYTTSNNATYNLNCNIDISGYSQQGELTGKIRIDLKSSSKANINGIVNLTGDTTIGSADPTEARGTLYFYNQITGNGKLTICPGTGNPVYLNNATSNYNNYKGDTQLGHPSMHGSKSYAGIVYLNADEQIPDVNTAGNAAVGNLIINSYSSSQPSKLYLNGHTETVNGLVSSDAYSTITGTTDSKLIVGANNATSTYAGKFQDAMQLEKIGTGTLTFSGESTTTGKITVTAGTLALTVRNAFSSSNEIENNSAITSSADQAFRNLSGAGTITFSNDAHLTLANSAPTSYSGSITGMKSITFTENAALDLTQATISAVDYFEAKTGSNVNISSDNPVNVSETFRQGQAEFSFSGANASISGSNVASQANIILNGGTMSIGYQAAPLPEYSGLALHLDASVASSFDNSSAITTWTNLANPENSLTFNNMRGNDKASVTQNAKAGLDVVTFPTSGGAYYDLASVIDGKTYFAVMADNGHTSSSQNSFLFANQGDAAIDGHNPYCYHRGDGTKLWNDTHVDNYIKTGITTLNGTAVPYNTADIGTDWNVLSIQASGAIPLSAISRERSNSNIPARGWRGDIAEILVYSEALTDEQVKAVSQYLATKWQVGNDIVTPAGENGAFVTTNTFTVAADSTIDVGGFTSVTFGSSTINNGKTLTINVSENQETVWESSLSGDGGLTKTGLGTLTLSQTPSYTGATTVSAGTLTLSAGGTLYNLSGSGTVDFGAQALTLSNSDDSEFSGIIQGAGTVTKNGIGTLTLSGANTYEGGTTVSEGKLILSGAAVGDIEDRDWSITVGDSGTLVFDVANGTKTLTVTEQNQLFSTGKVIKTGEGELKIDAADPGSIDAQSFVISSGRVDIKTYFDGQLEVKSGATFSPGNSVGPLTIDSQGVVVIGESTYGDGFILNEEGSKLLMEIGGSDVTDNDVLIVQNGNILLGSGIIELAMTDDCPLGLGESFTAVLSAENSNGLDVLGHIQTSDFTDLKYELISDATYGNVYAITGRRFNANEIPEPSTWALLLLGAAGLLYVRKRTHK